MSDNLNNAENNDYIDMPIVPLRGLVVFPDMVLHFDVGRKRALVQSKLLCAALIRFSCSTARSLC